MVYKQLLQGRYTIIKDPTDPSKVMHISVSSIVIRLSFRQTREKNSSTASVKKKFDRGVRDQDCCIFRVSQYIFLR